MKLIAPKPAHSALILVFLCSSLLTAALQAQPRPYHAEYKAKANGLDATAIRELQQQEEGEFLLSNSLDLKIAGVTVSTIHESSLFQWREQRITPLHYRLEQTRIGARLEEISFDWSAGMAQTRAQDGTYSLPLTGDNIQDRLSLDLQIAEDLARLDRGSLIGTELVYRVAETDELEEQRFRVEALEQVETAMGVIPAVRIVRVRAPDSKRKTTLWLATEQQFLLVALEQINSSGERTELSLSAYREL
ncbi:MAG: DUF3108 domain-containing protein [Pseudomonadales bacterium]|nr:DUF3108 domain-containing protein [Pseudomonadales bacterium]